MVDLIGIEPMTSSMPSLVAKQALGGHVKVNEWNDYEIIAVGGVMMHIMNGHLMAVLIDDNQDSANNQPGFIGLRSKASRASAQFPAPEIRLAGNNLTTSVGSEVIPGRQDLASVSDWPCCYFISSQALLSEAGSSAGDSGLGRIPSLRE